MKPFITSQIATIKGIIQIKDHNQFISPIWAPVQWGDFIITGLVLWLAWLTFWLCLNNLLSHFERKSGEKSSYPLFHRHRRGEVYSFTDSHTWQNKLLRQNRRQGRFYPLNFTRQELSAVFRVSEGLRFGSLCHSDRGGFFCIRAFPPKKTIMFGEMLLCNCRRKRFTRLSLFFKK